MSVVNGIIWYLFVLFAFLLFLSKITSAFIINTMPDFFFLVYFFLLCIYNETIEMINRAVRLC